MTALSLLLLLGACGKSAQLPLMTWLADAMAGPTPRITSYNVCYTKLLRASGGYQGLRKALTMTPQEVRELVKVSGLRGRGGAGFPTGVKWSFFPEAPGEKYLLANGDEMEPGTYKDHQLLLADPHQLVEGMAIAAYAMQIPHGYVFLRYAYETCARNVERAITEAESKGYLGGNILGSGFSFDLSYNFV